MAIYVPNVKEYLPKVEPFNPDYTFLSDVLNKRTDKYEKNFKALNNAYSKIVYSDLGRQDTNEARDQFVNNLQPRIEKISGLDLSLAQNVNAANAVFQPFYDNDLILRDMVQTKNINEIQKLANNLRTSPDEETRLRYYDQGLQFAQMQYQDFVNSSPNQALNEPLARYIEAPRLYERARKYLDDKGYKIKLGPKYTENGAYRITTTNGEDVTDLFLSDIREIFSKDPLVQDAYFADAYVQARTYAENGMQQGQFSNVTEGMAEWNRGIIQSSQDKLALRYDEISDQISQLNAMKKDYDKVLKTRSFPPGSESDIKYKNVLNQIEGKSAQLESLSGSINEATNLMNGNDLNSINNRGFNILFQSNIENDLFQAAKNYSFMTKEVDVEVDELYLKKYQHDLNMKMTQYKDKLQKNMEIFKSGLRMNEEKYKKDLEGDLSNATFADPFGEISEVIKSSEVQGLDSNGQPTSDAADVNYLITQDDKLLNLAAKKENVTATTLINMLEDLNDIKFLDNKVTVGNNQKFSSLSAEKQREVLLNEANVGNIGNYLDLAYRRIKDKADESGVVDLLNKYDQVQEQINSFNSAIEKYESVKVSNFETAKGSNDVIKKIIKQEIPTILKVDDNGNKTVITNLNEYTELLMQDEKFTVGYNELKNNQFLKKEIFQILNNNPDLLPDDFITEKKVKKDGKIITQKRFNPIYFEQRESKPSFGMPNSGSNNVRTKRILMNIANRTQNSYDELILMNDNNDKIKKLFDTQIQQLNNTFSNAYSDSGLYEKFDVNSYLQGSTNNVGDLVTNVGIKYPLRTPDEIDTKTKNGRVSYLKLQTQYLALNNAIQNKSSVFKIADNTEATQDQIRNTLEFIQDKYREAKSDPKKSKNIASVEYIPNVSPGMSRYVVRTMDEINATKDSPSQIKEGANIIIEIPTSEDINPRKSETFYSNEILRILNNKPNKKYTWEHGNYGRLDSRINVNEQIEYSAYLPYYNAKTGNIEVDELKLTNDNKYYDVSDQRANDQYNNLKGLIRIKTQQAIDNLIKAQEALKSSKQ